MIHGGSGCGGPTIVRTTRDSEAELTGWPSAICALLGDTALGAQGAAAHVSALRSGADRAWRSQERSADGGTFCAERLRSAAPFYCWWCLGFRAVGERNAHSSG